MSSRAQVVMGEKVVIIRRGQLPVGHQTCMGGGLLAAHVRQLGRKRKTWSNVAETTRDGRQSFYIISAFFNTFGENQTFCQKRNVDKNSE